MTDQPRASIVYLTTTFAHDPATGNFVATSPTMAVQSHCPINGFREHWRGSDPQEADLALKAAREEVGDPR